MMHPGRVPGQSKTEAHPLGLTGHERLEQALAELRRRSRAGVGDFDNVDIVLTLQFERDRTARASRFDGIESQVQYSGAKAGLVGHDDGGRRFRVHHESDPGMFTAGLNQQGDVVQQSERDRTRYVAALRAG